jgi:hypothetical protein
LPTTTDEAGTNDERAGEENSVDGDTLRPPWPASEGRRYDDGGCAARRRRTTTNGEGRGKAAQASRERRAVLAFEGEGMEKLSNCSRGVGSWGFLAKKSSVSAGAVTTASKARVRRSRKLHTTRGRERTWGEWAAASAPRARGTSYMGRDGWAIWPGARRRGGAAVAASLQRECALRAGWGAGRAGPGGWAELPRDPGWTR